MLWGNNTSGNNTPAYGPSTNNFNYTSQSTEYLLTFLLQYAPLVVAQ